MDQHAQSTGQVMQNPNAHNASRSLGKHYALGLQNAGFTKMPSIARTPLQIALRKRQEALESIALSRKRIAALEARISALDAEIASYGGKKWDAKPRLPFRANGEMQRALFELLREKGSATAADLAAIMLERFSIDAADSKSAWAMRQRCVQAFKRCERNGLVRHVGWSVGQRGKRGKFKRWALASSGSCSQPDSRLLDRLEQQRVHRTNS